MAVITNYGAAPTYVKIASQTLASAAASVTFSNIPQGYTDLILVVNEFNNTATNTSFQFRVGNESIDTGANYGAREIFGTGSSAGSDSEANGTAGYLNGPGIGTSTNIPNSYIMQFMSYSNATTYKSILVKGGSANQNTVALINSWRSFSPINTIRIFQSLNNMATGSTFTLYGIKAALVPKATGGDRIVQDGTYWYHTFLSSGTFIPSSSLTNVDYLIIAGGGGGTGYYVNNGYAGAGAGGLRSTVGTTGGGGSLESQISLSSATSYAVTIGAGGTSGGSGGSSGNNSSLSGTGLTTITSLGGGARNTTGGSGGGGSYDPNTYGLGTAGQGYRGGNGFIVGGGDTMGGGGGGAGAVGANATSTAGGNGGAGVQISALSVPTLTGVSGYYAGGGGGAAEAQGRTAGTGGVGGGGNGAVAYSNATNAIPNTGSGGGAAGSGAMGRGGSGLVILRYPI